MLGHYILRTYFIYFFETCTHDVALAVNKSSALLTFLVPRLFQLTIWNERTFQGHDLTGSHEHYKSGNISETVQDGVSK